MTRIIEQNGSKGVDHLLELKFQYPEAGYFFYPDERIAVTLSVHNTGDSEETVRFTGRVTDYEKKETGRIDATTTVAAGETKQVDFPITCERLGYYFVEIDAAFSGGVIPKKTGLGVLTPHERSAAKESFFGLGPNSPTPYVFAEFARIGVRNIRLGNTTVLDAERMEKIRKYGMVLTVQKQGFSIYDRNQRYASPETNSAYYYEKQFGDDVMLNEHGNECWEEGNVNLLAEWTKVSSLARLEANNQGWYSATGTAGIDINRFDYFREQGVFDYLTAICVHAYSFPGAPEGKNSYWSLERLVDLSRWMEKNNIHLPVCCTEQGYPAMYDQTKCECYCKGEMTTFDGQADYLVRSLAMFLSYGVARVVWFSANWYDGFGLLEKEGPAPWPAAMALAQLIRAVDHADYVGDWQNDAGVYFKVFRQKADGKLLAIIWRPVYYSRSCETWRNLSLDGTCTEADGIAKEHFDYPLHHVTADYVVKDIMGNAIPVKNDTIVIGERPVYVYGISEDIVPELKNLTIFRKQTVEPKPMPCKVILGFSDAWPEKSAFRSSVFQPGQSRQYRVRVHNYTDKHLDDTVLFDLPKPFSGPAELNVSVPAGFSREYTISVHCDDVALCGEYKLYARMKTSGAHEVYQIATVFSPVYFDPIVRPLAPGSELDLNLCNFSGSPKTYSVRIENPNLLLENDSFQFKLGAGKTETMHLFLKECRLPAEPMMRVCVTCGEENAVYETAIPQHYISYQPQVDPAKMPGEQMMVLSGYNMLMTAGKNYTGPALIGEARPEPLSAYARIRLDDQKLYFHFDIHDDTVVCTKNSRRNNIDSDGVWIRLYEKMDSESPYRHFCIMPVDQAGQTKGCSVSEVSSGILFEDVYTDYDFSKISVKSEVFADRYTIDVAIDRDSIRLGTMPKEIVADLRVINMNHNDWPKQYDTGKIAYKIIK